jgi:hypothetical protein
MLTEQETSTVEFQTMVKELLHDRDIKDLCITFTKADGTSREMHCTLVESRIPAEKIPKGTGRPSTQTSQRVFDVEKQEWRSFNWAAVTDYQFTR